MEELLELRQLLLEGNVSSALLLVDELEEMSLSDKINKIDSSGVILLIYLIKQRAEQRSMRSWEMSIENAVREIHKINRRRKSKGYFLDATELREILEEGYDVALKKAAIEAFEGRYETSALGERVDREAILTAALKLLIPDS
ncbi:MAG: DUF29 domain-containing protein [Drouetiella hepatica Uher 2000/2452]|jgi:ABC-type transporter Mla MlaB component|uniref:DUF29 domain-containing protein n=1 Tax=Drouetiella hepatica Uher 2000/2452 TaxID=904376 RepID=A0A951UKZ3_9CYAN|nr:DUF29 domain-containing protein [Drouetiella hepatica Uher 2000/2452]